MMRSDGATTDVLSSLPMIACCIVAVMVLIAAITSVVARQSASNESDHLSEDCRRLISEVMNAVTSEASDGRRYLAHDWQARVPGLAPDLSLDPGVSACIEVRVLGLLPWECTFAGNISECSEVRTLIEPVLIVDGQNCVPGELTAKVGA